MIVRRAIVRTVDAGSVGLEPTGSCEGCACSGRCAFGAGADAWITLPLACFDRIPAAGETLSLGIDASTLRDAALRAYGRLLAGLLLGASAGSGLASFAGAPIEVPVAAGAVAGTLLALRRSHHALALPRIETLTAGESDRP